MGCWGGAVWAFAVVAAIVIASEDKISTAARQAIALVNAWRISSALLDSTLWVGREIPRSSSRSGRASWPDARFGLFVSRTRKFKLPPIPVEF